jgi:hypothetical protein
MFPKWKLLNSHWIEFTIQYGYMISTISLQASWHPSHHSVGDSHEGPLNNQGKPA